MFAAMPSLSLIVPSLLPHPSTAESDPSNGATGWKWAYMACSVYTHTVSVYNHPPRSGKIMNTHRQWVYPVCACACVCVCVCPSKNQLCLHTYRGSTEPYRVLRLSWRFVCVTLVNSDWHLCHPAMAIHVHRPRRLVCRAARNWASGLWWLNVNICFRRKKKKMERIRRRKKKMMSPCFFFFWFAQIEHLYLDCRLDHIKLPLLKYGQCNRWLEHNIYLGCLLKSNFTCGA